MWSTSRYIATLMLAGSVILVAQAEDKRPSETLVSVASLMQTLEQNHAAADELFVGKRIHVRGRAFNVERFRANPDTSVTYLLRLEPETQVNNYGNAPGPHLAFSFPEKERKALAGVQRGMLLVIEATCVADEAATQGPRVLLQDCQLVRIVEPPAAIAPAARE